MSEINEYQAYTARNFLSIPQLAVLSDEEKREIEIVAEVLPFKSNSYVVNELINWENYADDPIFRLTFPAREMLTETHYNRMAEAMDNQLDRKEIRRVANEIRLELNPHPAGQLQMNVPRINGRLMHGLQHKYRETVLFFPSQGQTCHAYCTFCFRWPQFSGMQGMKFASRDASDFADYLRVHKEVTNVLFTGGDPLIMHTSLLEQYIEPLLHPDFEHIHTIRIGSKALAYWPYRFLTDKDAEELIALFEKINLAGKHLTLMAHFNHPVELSTKAVKQAIKKIRLTGTEIRTQSPVMKHINASASIWAKMWKMQVSLGMIPYYMFMARDTGAHHYFNISIKRAHEIYRDAYSKVSGMSKTVRGPVMSAAPGKIHVVGMSEVGGEKIFVLQFLQARNPDWVRRPFFAKYRADAAWLTDLEPFGEEKFFWQEEYEAMSRTSVSEAIYQEDE
ncbi:MAG: lysine 2,3-aminomutase [Lentimicrobium sp.]|jgi:KamA family protein|nr:lysine 2,3-aminomutase [Lentimicrobium sp.]MDY0024369.1 lysine 2,3-aminomutase [Lentimicrobium sp.]